MRAIGPCSEDEMIAVFLRGELDSDRFGALLASALDRHGADDTLLTSASLADARENALRRLLLDETRGYECRGPVRRLSR